MWTNTRLTPMTKELSQERNCCHKLAIVRGYVGCSLCGQNNRLTPIEEVTDKEPVDKSQTNS